MNHGLQEETSPTFAASHYLKGWGGEEWQKFWVFMWHQTSAGPIQCCYSEKGPSTGFISSGCYGRQDPVSTSGPRPAEDLERASSQMASLSALGIALRKSILKCKSVLYSIVLYCFTVFTVCILIVCLYFTVFRYYLFLYIKWIFYYILQYHLTIYFESLLLILWIISLKTLHKKIPVPLYCLCV